MRSYLSFVSLSACLLAACGSTDLPEGADDSEVGRVASPIINGQLDTTHQAVVALVMQQGNQGGLCTGTIIKVDPATRVGWVLTAAHCTELPIVAVLQGDDVFNGTPKQYAVLDYEADSRYQIGGQADQNYDVAVVRILGVDANMPTIPIATQSDGVGGGTKLTALGYGRTAGGTGSQGEADGKRRRVTVSVQQTNQTLLGFSMTPGGTCQGDSGGPDLLAVGGGEKVVGIHSYGDTGCQSNSVSGRVSGNLAFINKQLAKSVPALTCDQCQQASLSGDQKCAQLSSACLADKDCNGLYSCLTKAGSSASAQKKCTDQYPSSVGKILSIQSCGCKDDCATACASDANCKAMPQCGFSLPEGTCATCGEASCCQEMSDCVEDGTCFQCLQSGDADASCGSNAARKAVASCFQSKCSSECSDTGIDKGAPDGGASGTGDPGSDGTSGTEDGTANGASPGSSTVTTTTSGCSMGSSGNGSAGGVVSALALSSLALAFARRRRRAA